MSPGATPILELRELTKRYGEVEALRGISLAIAAGEIVAMLGPNGAGKTTSISLMLGLRRPSSGDVRLFGLPPTDRRARSRVGVMLQESGAPGVLTVRELIGLFGTYYPAPLPVAQALAMAGLEDKADARVATLSGGQRQRLYFALAVGGNPEALFLDEPTVGMDIEARRAFVTAIQALAAAGKSVIFTTHYLREAEELATRIVVARPLPADAFAGLVVTALDVSDGRVRFLTSEPETALRRLFERGVEPHDLEVAGADLEEAVLSLTRRPERA